MNKEIGMKNELTKKQKKLLNFCVENAKVIPPTYDEMTKFMNVKSKQSCFDMIKLIEKKMDMKLGDIVSIGRSTQRNLGGVGSNPTIPTDGTHYQDYNYQIYQTSSPVVNIK